MHNDEKQLLKLIGRRVTNIRKLKGMTQLELGEASSKMINTISNIERGLVDVKITTLNDIAKALGMPLDEFVANENPVIRDENRTLYRETIHTIRKLNPEDMKKMLDIIKLFIKHSKHTKPVDYLSSIRI